jgi:hypothetical protein
LSARRTEFVLLSIFLLFFFGSAALVYGADSYFGAHIGIESDTSGVLHLRPGIDFRSVGGRGVLGGIVSLDYFPVNTREYAGSALSESSVLFLSAYALAQFSFMYGDAAFYAGPGVSMYYVRENDGYITLLEDKILHTKFGGLFTYYPLQFFIETDIDLTLLPFSYGIARPHFTLGVSILR